MGLVGAMLKTKQAESISREKLEDLKQKRLKRLVDYARANSQFYNEKFKALGDDYKLSDIPPTTKPEMMESFDSVLTDRNITMKRIDEFTAD
nr:hypothetical protein [Lachnospiraceae bacterium]